MKPQSRNRKRQRTGFFIILISSAFLLPYQALADDPKQVDSLVRQWLEIERQVTHLQSDWKAQQPVLIQRLALLKAEKQQLHAMLTRSNTSEDGVNERRTALLSEQSKLEQQQAQMAQLLMSLTSRTAEITPKLPPALAVGWKNEQKILNEKPDSSMQLQVALAQLTKLADFTQRVSVHESTVTTPDGRDILVKQLYLGISIAWFTSRNGEYSGWGQAGPQGWQWHFANNDYADEIGKAIAIFEKRQAADLVSLPIRLAIENASPTVKEDTL